MKYKRNTIAEKGIVKGKDAIKIRSSKDNAEDSCISLERSQREWPAIIYEKCIRARDEMQLFHPVIGDEELNKDI